MSAQFVHNRRPQARAAARAFPVREVAGVFTVITALLLYALL